MNVCVCTFCMLSLISEVLRLPLANLSLSRLATDSSPALDFRGDNFSPEEKTKHKNQQGSKQEKVNIILPVEHDNVDVVVLFDIKTEGKSVFLK